LAVEKGAGPQGGGDEDERQSDEARGGPPGGGQAGPSTENPLEPAWIHAKIIPRGSSLLKRPMSWVRTSHEDSLFTHTHGRDHHPTGFSMGLAGGGVKSGLTYGATAELGFKALENPIHVRDLHATILRTEATPRRRRATRRIGARQKETPTRR